MNRLLWMLCAFCVLSAVPMSAREATAGPDQNQEVVSPLAHGTSFGLRTVFRLGNAGPTDGTVDLTCWDQLGILFHSDAFLLKSFTRTDIDSSQLLPPSADVIGHCRARANVPIFGAHYIGVPGPMGLWGPGTMFLNSAPATAGVAKFDAGAYWWSSANWRTFGIISNAADSAVQVRINQFSANALALQQLQTTLAPRATLAYELQSFAGSNSGVVDFDIDGPGGIAGWHIYANPSTGSAYSHEIAADAVNFVRFQF